METTSIRIAIEQEETGIRRPLIISCQDDKTRLLSLALNLFKIPLQNLQEYELFIQILDCEVQDAQTLCNNDILILKNTKNKGKLADENFLDMSELKKNLDYDIFKDDVSYISENQPKEILMEDEERKFEEFGGENSREVSFNLNNEKSIDDNDEKTSSNSTIFSNSFSDEEENNESEKEVNIEISIQNLIGKEFKDRKVLGDEIKQWASQEKMKLSFKTAEIFNKKDNIYVSTLYCSKKESLNCSFYLEFLKAKGKQYSLMHYFNSHNHELDPYSSANEITEEIIQHIIKLQPIHNNAPVITKIINDVYKKNFSYRTIYYQIKKLKNVEYGEVNKDATNFIDMLEKDAQSRGGFF